MRVAGTFFFFAQSREVFKQVKKETTNSHEFSRMVFAQTQRITRRQKKLRASVSPRGLLKKLRVLASLCEIFEACITDDFTSLAKRFAAKISFRLHQLHVESDR